MSYDLLVEVRDKAGNATPISSEGHISTKEWIAKIGDYVLYTPDNGTFDMTEEESTTKDTYAVLSGSGSQTTKFTTEKFNWRILNIDEENELLTIVAYGMTSSGLAIYGTQGYNNGVGILDEICKACFSRETKRCNCKEY